MAIVYAHFRADDHQIFYVGIGKEEKRAYWRFDRRQIWDRIVAKHGYYVEILCRDISWETAKEIEQFLIRHYGRLDKRTGVLANMTDGGDGAIGLKISDESKRKMSQAKKGTQPRLGVKLSDETRAKISKALIGRKIPRDIVEKISAANRGRKGPMAGRCHTDDAKAKIVASLVGRPSRHMGHKMTDSAKEKIRASLKEHHPRRGVKNSAEHNLKAVAARMKAKETRLKECRLFLAALYS